MTTRLDTFAVDDPSLTDPLAGIVHSDGSVNAVLCDIDDAKALIHEREAYWHVPARRDAAIRRLVALGDEVMEMAEMELRDESRK